MAGVTLFKDIQFNGSSQTFDKDTPQLPAAIADLASSIRIDRAGWIIFYSKPNFSGKELYIRGPFQIPDLRKFKQGLLGGVPVIGDKIPILGGDWNDDIESFRFVSQRPSGKGTYVNDGPSVDPQVRKDLLAFINSMKELEVKEPGVKQRAPAVNVEEGGQSITREFSTETVNVTDLAGFNPNIGVVWPGAFVQGSSLKSGVLAAVNTRRAPLELLLSTIGVPAPGAASTTHAVSAVVPNPSASSAEAARQKLVAQGGVIPAKYSFTFKQFFSFEQAMIQVGASVEYLSAKMKADLSSESFKTQSNLIISVTQEFYTLAAEPPQGQGGYFADDVSVEELKPFANTTDNPLCYVQSVTYGRQALVIVSSSEEFDTLKRSVSAAVTFMQGKVEGSFSEEERRVVENSSVKILFIGGSPDKALRVVLNTQDALTALDGWLNQTVAQNPKLIELGLPITYRVNYLKNNQVARLAFSADFDRERRDTIPFLSRWRITFFTNDDDKDHDSTVTVEVLGPGDRKIAAHSETGKKYGNGSTEGFALNPISTLFERDSGTVRVKIRIDPNGDDEWDFRYELVADRSSGGTFQKGGNMRLKEDDRERIQ